jgi:hypothetical protein
MWTEIVLWLFVVNLGTAFGAGVFESRVIVPQWKSLPPPQWPDTGRRFWAHVTTVPLTLLTIASFFAASTTEGPGRSWYFAACFIALVERIATFSYFIPTMVRLMRAQSLSTTERATLSRWQLVNYGRHILNLGAFLAGLKALSLLG